MARFLLFLILLAAGWGLIFLPLAAENQAIRLPGLTWSSSPLPQPWVSGTAVEMQPQEAASESGAPVQGGCVEDYVVQSGETLGQIARRCGISLQSLLSANPQISDPNHIRVAQSIHLPILAGRGGGDDIGLGLSGLSPRYFPGSQVDIQVSGLPPGATARIGMGLSSAGYRVLREAVSGADGRLVLSLAIPEDALPGDSAFLLVTTSGVPSIQVISPEFIISAPE